MTTDGCFIRSSSHVISINISFVSSGFFYLKFNFFPVVPLFDQVSLRFFYMSFIVSGCSANSLYMESLAECNTLLAMRRMEATTVEVLVGVHRLGVKVCHQEILVSYYPCVEECHKLPRPLSGELYCRME